MYIFLFGRGSQFRILRAPSLVNIGEYWCLRIFFFLLGGDYYCYKYLGTEYRNFKERIISKARSNMVEYLRWVLEVVIYR